MEDVSLTADHHRQFTIDIMKITKRQLRKMINEMYPVTQGVTLARLEQLTMAHENLVKDVEELYEEIG